MDDHEKLLSETVTALEAFGDEAHVELLACTSKLCSQRNPCLRCAGIMWAVNTLASELSSCGDIIPSNMVN